MQVCFSSHYYLYFVEDNFTQLLFKFMWMINLDQVYEEETHVHTSHAPKQATAATADSLDDEGVQALKQVLENLEREFTELKGEYNYLVVQYDMQAESANPMGSSNGSNSRPSTANGESKRLSLLGDKLRDVIQLMDVKVNHVLVYIISTGFLSCSFLT